MLRPIRNEEDYETALEEIEALWEATPGTAEADHLEILVMLVEAYFDISHFSLTLMTGWGKSHPSIVVPPMNHNPQLPQIALAQTLCYSY